MIDMYLKVAVQNLQKLMDKTPACVVAFLGGALPGTALLHMRQLNLFGMVTRLPGSILNTHSKQVLISARPSASSWFQQIRDLCLQYQLPHPLFLLEQPMSKLKFNRIVKSKVINYWEIKFRGKASSLTSAPFFNPAFMSLTRPHPIWTACGSNPFECHKAVITSRMLSGRYLTDRLQRHWTLNKSGKCLLPNCFPASDGSLEHLLLHCSALSLTRSKLLSLCVNIAEEDDKLYNIINSALMSSCEGSAAGSEHRMMQFLLDCTVMPEVVAMTQNSGNVLRDRLLYIGRTWCYSIHRERMNQLGLLEFR